MRKLLAGLGLLALLAGCVGDSGEAAKLSFEGGDSGTHDDSAKCDDDATLVGTGSIDDGTVTVTVTDGSGDEKFTREFDAGIDLSGERLEGSSGTWTLSATRMADDLVGDGFQGSYTFNLSC